MRLLHKTTNKHLSMEAASAAVTYMKGKPFIEVRLHVDIARQAGLHRGKHASVRVKDGCINIRPRYTYEPEPWLIHAYSTGVMLKIPHNLCPDMSEDYIHVYRPYLDGKWLVLLKGE